MFLNWSPYSSNQSIIGFHSSGYDDELNCGDFIRSNWKMSSLDWLDFSFFVSLDSVDIEFDSIWINMNWCWSVWIRQQMRMTWFPWYYSVFLESLRVLDSDLHLTGMRTVIMSVLISIYAFQKNQEHLKNRDSKEMKIHLETMITNQMHLQRMQWHHKIYEYRMSFPYELWEWMALIHRTINRFTHFSSDNNIETHIQQTLQSNLLASNSNNKLSIDTPSKQDLLSNILKQSNISFTINQ